MNYELALELREAGFPGTFTGECKTGCNVPNEDLTDFAYCPTLEELIDVCGDGSFNLHHRKDGVWEVEVFYKTISQIMTVTGKTPTEAVAHLWLALNKKT